MNADAAAAPRRELAAELARRAVLRVASDAAPGAASVGAEIVGGSDRLWSAWQRLMETEERVAAEMGREFGRQLLVFWALARLGHGGSPADAVLADLVDDNLHPRFTDWLLEDVALLSFSLGAAWADSPDAGSNLPPA